MSRSGSSAPATAPWRCPPRAWGCPRESQSTRGAFEVEAERESQQWRQPQPRRPQEAALGRSIQVLVVDDRDDDRHHAHEDGVPPAREGVGARHTVASAQGTDHVVANLSAAAPTGEASATSWRGRQPRAVDRHRDRSPAARWVSGGATASSSPDAVDVDQSGSAQASPAPRPPCPTAVRRPPRPAPTGVRRPPLRCRRQAGRPQQRAGGRAGQHPRVAEEQRRLGVRPAPATPRRCRPPARPGRRASPRAGPRRSLLLVVGDHQRVSSPLAQGCRAGRRRGARAAPRRAPTARRAAAASADRQRLGQRRRWRSPPERSPAAGRTSPRPTSASSSRTRVARRRVPAPRSA